MKILFLPCYKNAHCNIVGFFVGNDSGNNVFMIHHKRSIFLCLFMYCKNICTLLMCNRESESDKLDQKAADYGHPKNNISLFEVWSQWKGKVCNYQVTEISKLNPAERYPSVIN